MSFCVGVAKATPSERIDMVRRGVAPEWLGRLARALRIAEEHLMLYLGIDRRVVLSRLAEGDRLDAHDSDAVVATARLVGDALNLHGQGDPPAETGGADIAGQVGTWLRTAMPDLDRRAPIQYLDVAEGRALVARLWMERHATACESVGSDAS
jgi:uncharacterized protein (DUF2384 family)